MSHSSAFEGTSVDIVIVIKYHYKERSKEKKKKYFTRSTEAIFILWSVTFDYGYFIDCFCVWEYSVTEGALSLHKAVMSR